MCTHNSMVNGLTCADRYIKLLLLNKVTYCYLLKSTASAFCSTVYPYIDPRRMLHFVIYIAMYRGTSK